MSAVTIARIKSSLLSNFGAEIDMGDYEGKPEKNRERALISRALAASFIQSETGCSHAEAALSVTDGFDDNAIDAVKFDQTHDRFLIVTSGWSKSGKSKFDQAEIAKLVAGVRRLLSFDLTGFNQKFTSREAEIREALHAPRQIEIVIAVVHTGSQKLAPHTLQPLSELASEINDPVETCSIRDVPQSGVYQQITAASQDPSIELQAVLEDWGQITYPHLAYYGRVGISQIARWWQEHGSKLFTQNLRLYYPSSSVNSAVKRTVAQDPKSFWYFNNGITLIADEIVKGVVGSPHHRFGSFTCKGASIVNGAQTVGSIGAILSPDSAQETTEEVTEEIGYVQVRLISLQSCPPDFAADTTKAANLQNAVGTREFAAMDLVQQRLALDFALDGRRYAYKSGDTDPDTSSGCTLTEATQALGCMVSVRCATEIKREIGTIYADTKASPYIDIFPDSLSAITLWRSVLAMRAVEGTLQALRTAPEIPKADMVATHLNRIILHLVFKNADISKFVGDHDQSNDVPGSIDSITTELFKRVCNYIEENFDNAYLASFAKSRSKCEALVNYIETGGHSGSDGQMEMFDESDQSKRFKEAARNLGADESDYALDNALEKLDLTRKPEADEGPKD